MQAIGAYAIASANLAAFAPQRRPQQWEPRSKRASRARTLVRSFGIALARWAGESATPRIPRLDSYPY